MHAQSSPTAYLRNATTAPNFVAWAAAEAERSLRFQGEIERLRYIAAGPHRAGYARTTGPLTSLTWIELNHALKRSRDEPQKERRRAWKDTDMATDEGLRHVHEYLRGARKVARQFLGSESVAPLIHELVAATGYALEPTHVLAPPAPTDAQASSLAAHITGASWGSGATALTAAWRRSRPGDHVFVL